MNKRNVRSFGLGMLFAVSVTGISYYTFEKGVEKQDYSKISVADAKKMLEAENYSIYSATEKTAFIEEIKNESVEDYKKELETEELNKAQAEIEKDPIQQQIVFQLEVKSGMTSSDIVNSLFKAKIIDEPGKLQQYLDENGYSTKIQLGIFVFTNNMSYKQIAKVITKS